MKKTSVSLFWGMIKFQVVSKAPVPKTAGASTPAWQKMYKDDPAMIEVLQKKIMN